MGFEACDSWDDCLAVGTTAAGIVPVTTAAAAAAATHSAAAAAAYWLVWAQLVFCFVHVPFRWHCSVCEFVAVTLSSF